jgi:uncharacterized protein YxjI
MLQPQVGKTIVFRHVGNLLRVGDFVIQDEEGAEIGSVDQQLPKGPRRFIRPLGRLDPLASHRLVLQDHDGSIIARIHRPPVLLRAHLRVADGNDRFTAEFRQRLTIRSHVFDIYDRSSRSIASLEESPRYRFEKFILRVAEEVVADIEVRIPSLLDRGKQPIMYFLRVNVPLEEPLAMIGLACAPCIHSVFNGRF